MTVSELKEELKKRSLPVSGRKDDLVSRLLKNEGIEEPKPKKQKVETEEPEKSELGKDTEAPKSEGKQEKMGTNEAKAQ